MNNEQFDALASLLRLRPGRSQNVARMVLVQGLTVPDAARLLGMQYTVAHQAVRRAQRGLELAQQAVAQKKGRA